MTHGVYGVMKFTEEKMEDSWIGLIQIIQNFVEAVACSETKAFDEGLPPAAIPSSRRNSIAWTALNQKHNQRVQRLPGNKIVFPL